MAENKKGMELSINFIVVVILSIVILSLGLVLVKNFFTKTTEIKATLDEQTKSKISELLSFGEITAIPFNKREVSSGEYAIFGLGVLNVEKQEKTLAAAITANKAYDRSNNPIASFGPGMSETEWLLYDSDSFTLLPNDQKEIEILIKVPKAASRGTYVFDVIVMDIVSGSRYGNVNKIYVEVP